VSIKRNVISPWLDVLAREVQFSPEAPAEVYYAISQPSYLTALAVTSENEFVLVRQYRPAIECLSLELPAGLLEQNEEPAPAMVRELLEETGYSTRSIELIGKTATCSSRISNVMYSFFIHAGERAPDFVEEPGVSVVTVTPGQLRRLILSGEFNEQTHLGALSLAAYKGLIEI